MLNTDQKRRLRDGLDILATKNMELSDVSSPWNIMHGTGTSELEDLKLAVRQDSTPPQDYWVGFFEHRGRRQSIIQPVLIQASFSTIPDSAPIVHELRQALAVQMLHAKGPYSARARTRSSQTIRQLRLTDDSLPLALPPVLFSLYYCYHPETLQLSPVPPLYNVNGSALSRHSDRRWNDLNKYRTPSPVILNTIRHLFDHNEKNVIQ